MIYPSEIELSQALVQAFSPSAKESPAATVLLAAFEQLGFDDNYLDDAGNAIGLFKRGSGPDIMLNGHIDTVPLGNPDLWRQPALSGAIVEGELWGRGSVDMKSALACMAFAAKDAINAGFQGTVSVTGVVQEEVGGVGARHLGQIMKPDVIILGEPSNLNLMLGHRGRIEINVKFPGTIAHAAKNELGKNALYEAATFLEKVKHLDLPTGGPLIGSSLTPTFLQSQPVGGRNVVPGEANLIIDYRNIPGDEPEHLIAKLQALAPEAVFEVAEEVGVTENGKVNMTYPAVSPAYLAPGENSFIQHARPIIKESLAAFDVALHERCWWFATDAPYLSAHGAPVIGFGPGLEDLAHTTQERVPIKHLEIARVVYKDLLLAFSA